MNENYLKDEARAAIVQKDELSKAQNKIAEVNLALDRLEAEQDEAALQLDELLLETENLSKEIQNNNRQIDDLMLLEAQILLKNLENDKTSTLENKNQIAYLDKVDFDDNWDDYLKSAEEYITRNDLKIHEDPFQDLMSKTQLLELQKRVKEDFTYKNANCDVYDYLIAATCGAISGLIDILFVVAPGQDGLSKFTDEMANKTTEKFAQMLGWDKEKAMKKGSNTLKSATGFLERKFKINYDQVRTNGKNGTGGMVEYLNPKNHHLKSAGHSPDIIGLFVSILNQFTSTSTFINNGQIITIDTETFDLQGGNFIAKIFCGFANWFGHLASDWTGSSGSQGRGSGIPIPFYNLFLMCDFGSFGQHRQTFAQIATKVFEGYEYKIKNEHNKEETKKIESYDFRHGIAMAIPVAITELLTRFMYVMKARFYYCKDWKECIPNANIPELRRMLLVGHGTLCLIDGVDAGIRSGNPIANPVVFLSHTNLLAWVRFSHLALKEIKAIWKTGEIDNKKLDEYIDQEFKIMLNKIR
ncbi:coiled-coil domain-containing protein [Campylobacter coli]|uniref:coiled-coil domain-containing protein n=1 Tax=Campylobacter coli TaxID=195 RepID=UPI000ACB3552|nr:hypothetical protein [Campylobacter coli]